MTSEHELNIATVGALHAGFVAAPEASYDRVIPLSYILRQQQLGSDMAKAMGNLWQYILSQYPTYWEWHANEDLNKSHGNRDTTGSWTTKDMTLWMNSGGSLPSLQCKVRYEYQGVVQDESGFTRGKENILSSNDFEQPGKAWLINLLKSSQPLNFQRQESVTLSQSSSTEMDHTTEIDVGTEAEQKATIGGAETGGSLEAGIKESFGYSDTKEEDKTEARSKDQSEGTTIDEDCPEFEATLITVNSDDIHSDTPRGWHGPSNYGVVIDVPIEGFLSEPQNYTASPLLEKMRHGARYHEYSASIPELSLSDAPTGRWGRWTWPDWQSFLSFLDGTDTDLPFMIDVRIPARFSDPLHDPDNRRIDLDGTEHRDYEQGARVVVAQVNAGDLDAVIAKHGITPDRIIEHSD